MVRDLRNYQSDLLGNVVFLITRDLKILININILGNSMRNKIIEPIILMNF